MKKYTLFIFLFYSHFAYSQFIDNYFVEINPMYVLADHQIYLNRKGDRFIDSNTTTFKLKSYLTGELKLGVEKIFFKNERLDMGSSFKVLKYDYTYNIKTDAQVIKRGNQFTFLEFGLFVGYTHYFNNQIFVSASIENFFSTPFYTETEHYNSEKINKEYNVTERRSFTTSPLFNFLNELKIGKSFGRYKISGGLKWNRRPKTVEVMFSVSQPFESQFFAVIKNHFIIPFMGVRININKSKK